MDFTVCQTVNLASSDIAVPDVAVKFSEEEHAGSLEGFCFLVNLSIDYTVCMLHDIDVIDFLLL